MRYRRVLAVALGICLTGLLAPSAALGYTTDLFGRSYGGQAECISCHNGLQASDRTAYLSTRHALMVSDVRANPSALVPLASSTTLWPSPTLGTGIRFAPANVYLQIGGGPIKEYISTYGESLPAVSGVATVPVPANTPADDLPLFDGITFDTDLNEWEVEGAVSVRGYFQRCGGCHNLGLTRPSSDTMTLPNGTQISPTTPTSVQGLSIQCEVCHGTGSFTTLHEAKSPEVLAWKSSSAAPGRILSAEMCGQCHATGTAKQRLYKSSTSYFSSPTGYTPDETLADYFTVVTEVPTEASYTVNPTAYRFYPNGANRNMNHVYYNEWLNNKAANGFGHLAPTNTSVKRSGGKCLGCHSGEGFLERIGDPIVPAAYDVTTSTVMSGISCQICHSSHDPVRGLSLRQSSDPEIGVVDCSDCHNWQFEVLGQQIPSESAFATGYVGMRVRHPQREMYEGRGLFGVAEAGVFMPDVECADCHMPETREDRISHRFHVMTPGDAEEWGVREEGDSCTPCHPGLSRDQLQEELDDWQDATRDLVREATSTMNAARVRMGITGTETSFIGTSSVDPEVVAYKMAFHNRDFVQNDASVGAHNPQYAQAGLRYSIAIARSIGGTVSLSAPTAAGYDVDVPVMGVATLGDGTFLEGDTVELQARPVGETEFTTFATVKTNSLGAFTGVYRLMGLTEVRALWNSASGDKASDPQLVTIAGYGPLAMVDRVGGDDRYETATLASQALFTTGSVPNVVLASGANFADALAANGLAGAAASPLLLTKQADLPDVTAEEIDRVSPEPAGTTVWLVGGEAAIGSAVVDELEAAGYSVVRIGGSDRYDTAALVAAEVKDIIGAGFVGEAFVVNGRAFPDGIAVAPVSYATGRPVLLVAPDSLPAATSDALTALGITKVYVAGGTSAVGSAVFDALPVGSERVAAGTDRYETAAQFAQWAVDEGLASPALVGVASGAAFPDALSAGAPVGASGGVLLLSSADVLSGPAAGFLSDNRADVDRTIVFGGLSALSNEVRIGVYEALNP